MLHTVTLTGADDQIDPRELVKMSTRFPFVEWGILVGSNVGPRFPSEEWLDKLGLAVAETQARVQLSLHLCGRWLRALLENGQIAAPDSLNIEHFTRAQLNFHAEPIAPMAYRSIVSAFSGSWITPIVQLDGVNDHVMEEVGESGIHTVQGLYDQSHGAGELPEEWPAPDVRYDIGYAGGLGAENVERQVREISCVTNGQRFWIDMESKIRTKGQFDLWQCKCVLEYCEPLIGKSLRAQDGHS